MRQAGMCSMSAVPRCRAMAMPSRKDELADFICRGSADGLRQNGFRTGSTIARLVAGGPEATRWGSDML